MGILDRSTFDRLVREHLPACLRFATRLTGSVDAAEELVQDALVRVSRNWRSFRGESEFPTWLFGVVVNAFRDRLAKRPEPGRLPDDLADAGGKNPARDMLDRELGELVAAAVSRLPPRQREVLVLITYEGLTTAEAATALNITEQNVRTTLHLAREQLRVKLAAYLTEPSRERR
jgi:RNA polymerase sigma-70 factor (ECF subfamily)